MGHGPFNPKPTCASSKTEVGQVNPNMLDVIDFVDAGSRELVFRGVGRAKVNTEERQSAAINTVVSRVLAAIPRLGQK